MKALEQKLLRDLWRLRGQVIAVALVIASGVAVLVMSLSTHEALTETTAVYYERYRFGDVFASSVRTPARIADQIADIPGVQSVQTRVARYATLDIEGFAEPVIGRLTSIPETGQPALNQLALRSGRWIEPGQPDQVILSEPFAEAHGLRPGDQVVAVINARRRELTVVGTALSPEFVYALGPGTLLPDDRRFGILWMGREALAAAFDLRESFNDLSLTLLRNTDPEPVIGQVDSLLEPYGGTSALPRANQISNWFVMNEISQLEAMSTILPTIFLSVAAFLTHMVLSRLIATERSEIGLLKAFGYRDWQIAWHYMKLAVAVALIGIVLGSVMGAFVGRFNTQLYADVFRFPLLIYRPSPGAFLIAALISLAASLAGAGTAVRHALMLPPAEAMRPPAPTTYRRGALVWLGIGHWLDEPTRIAMRQIARWPLRAGLTTLGLALSTGLLVMALQWTDSIDHIARTYFYEAQHQTITVGLAEPEVENTIRAFARLPGVLAAEPVRIVGADFSVRNLRHRGSIIAIAADNRLQPIHDDATGRDVDVPPRGLVLGSELAAKLGVEIGDRVWVDVQTGRRPQVAMPVADIVEVLIGMPAYMDLDALNDILGEPPSLEFANLLVDKNAEPELFAQLKHMPRVSAVMLRQAALDAFYDTVGEHLLIYIGIFTVFACALGFGVAYNAARISLSERGRELATLRVLGFTRREISYVLLGELALLILVALPLGCLGGWALVGIMAQAFNTELFRLPLVVEASTYGIAVLFTLAATAASAALVRRRVDRLDLIRVLKTRE